MKAGSAARLDDRVGPYFLLRRCTRVRLSSLRCFFLAMRLRRFLMTEPMPGAYVMDGVRRQPASMYASRR